MYKVNVIVSFAGAHHLEGYEGACRNLHGHNWKVRVQLAADDTDECGMAIDFGIVKEHLRDLIKKFDHQYLNKLEWFQDVNPTSENIARVIFQELQERISSSQCPASPTPDIDNVRVSEVEVWESDTTSIIYTKQ